VISPEGVLKVVAFGSGVYLIHEYYRHSRILTEHVLPWGVFGLAGLTVGWLSKFGLSEKTVKEKRLPTTPSSVAMSLFGSYMLVEHGNDLINLASKVAMKV